MTNKTSPPPPLSSSLADLLRARGVSVNDDAPTPAPTAGAPAVTQALELSARRRIVLRRERKGHGGKTVTVIEGLDPATDRLEILARHLRKALGCGARVDAGRVVVQGDHVEAAAAWLRAHGATRITQGN